MNDLKTNSLLSVIFIFSLYISFAYGTLYYSSTLGPDFDYYKGYLDYFFGNKDTTNLEQGLIYFYFSSLFVSFKSEYINIMNYQEIVSHAIQLNNFLFYLLGLFGLFTFLKRKLFKTKIILIVLIILNFFPPLVELRLLFKSEIIIFPLLIWTINFLDQYLIVGDKKYLLFSILPLGIIFTTKANTGLMIFIYFMIFYFIPIFKKNKNNFIYSFFILLALFISLSYENFKANDLLIFQHDLPVGFNQKASLSFLYNIDLRSLFDNPFRHSQNNSYLGILILDTFNDYFTISWNDDSSIFYLDTVPLISIKLKPFLGIIFTLIMYLFIAYKFAKNKENRYIFFMPIIGIFVQMVISQFTGFNPDTGDIAKTYYYGFFLGIVFAFICATILKKSFLPGLFLLLLITVSSIHIFGFPKYENNYKNDLITFNNQVAFGCSVNEKLFDLENSNCVGKNLDFCEYMYLKSEKIEISNSTYILNNYDLRQTNVLLMKNNNLENSSSFEECLRLINNNFIPVKSLKITNIPYLNLLTFVLFFVSTLYFVANEKNALKF